MKKLMLFLCAFLAIIGNASAQLKRGQHFEDTNLVPQEKLKDFQDDVFKNSPYVFEGRVLKTKSWEDLNGHIFTSRLVKIEKVRRGNLQNGTIEIISQYGCIDNDSIHRSYCEYVGYKSNYGNGEDVRFDGVHQNADWGIQEDTEQSNLYFCKSTNRQTAFKENTDNSLKLELYRDGYTIMTKRYNHMDKMFYYSGIKLSVLETDIFDHISKKDLYSKKANTTEKKLSGSGEAQEKSQIIDPNLSFDKVITVAGNQEVITITRIGGGLGTAGKVYFRDANTRNNLTYEHQFLAGGLDPMDYTWYDNKIIIKLPAYVKAGYPNTSPPPNVNVQSYGVAASGEIKVIPNDGPNAGIELITAKKISVKYAFYQEVYPATNPTEKKRLYIANYKCRKGYKLVAHTSLSSAQRTALFLAAQHWNDRLGYNIFIYNANATPVSYTTNSGVECVVSEGLSYNTSKTGSYDNSFVQIGTSGVYEKVLQSFSITVPPANEVYIDSPVYNTVSEKYVYSGTVPSNKSDFYADILHELGHGLGLTHVIIPFTAYPKDLMYAFDDAPIGLASTPTNRPSLSSAYKTALEGMIRITNDSKLTWGVNALQVNSGAIRPIGEIAVSSPCLPYDASATTYEKVSVTKSQETNVTYQWQYKNNTTTTWTNIPIPTTANVSSNGFNITVANKNEILLSAATYPIGTKLQCITTVTPCDCEVGASNAITSQEITVIPKIAIGIAPKTYCYASSTTVINTLDNAFPTIPTGGIYEIENCLGCITNNYQFKPAEVGIGEHTLIYRLNCQEYRLPKRYI